MFLQKFIKPDRPKILASQNKLSRSYNVTTFKKKNKNEANILQKPSIPINSKTHLIERRKIIRYTTQPEQSLLKQQSKSLDQIILNYIRNDGRKKTSKLRAKNHTKSTERSVDINQLMITNSNDRAKSFVTISQTKSELFVKDKQRQQYSPYRDHIFFKTQQQEAKRNKQRKTIFKNINMQRTKVQDPTMLQIRKVDFQQKIENRRIFNSYKMLVARQRIRNNKNISFKEYQQQKKSTVKKYQNYSIQPW